MDYLMLPSSISTPPLPKFTHANVYTHKPAIPNAHLISPSPATNMYYTHEDRTGTDECDGAVDESACVGEYVSRRILEQTARRVQLHGADGTFWIELQ